MTEFKVGDKVRALGTDDGEITYGPVRSTFDRYTIYVVRKANGMEVTYQSGDLAAAPVAFAVGDKVRKNGYTAEILAGPVPGADTGEDVYLYKYTDGPNAGKGGGQRAFRFEALPTPAIVPVGTRVRVDRAVYAEETHGKVGTVVSNTGDFRADDGDPHVYRVQLGGHGHVHAAEVTPVDEPADPAWTYNGVTYAPGVDYTDSDGDPWRFALVDGELRGDYGQSRFRITADSYSVGCAGSTYGPFDHS
jgi:hypothetical protein